MFQGTSIKKFLERLKQEKIDFIDLRFSDTQGVFHHFTLKSGYFTEALITSGLVIDGSSLTGWKSIDDSDMLLMPDLSSVARDPFSKDPTLIIFCFVYDPLTQSPYSRDPRSTAIKAERYLMQTRIADIAYFGPEPEFFVFEQARFHSTPFESFYALKASETAHESPFFPSSDAHHAHRPQPKGGYLPVTPLDSGQALRSDMLNCLEKLGIKAEKHHHEVASNQHELGFEYNTLLKTADHIQLFKYAVHNIALQHGKTATFMPKPLFGDNGSGMHIHQSLWQKTTPLFAGDHYAQLSQTALYYIGGILHHARALNAFTNPTTNSYKRLVAGFEAPVIRAYSSRNRSASIRIPYTASEKARRIEVRFPDPSANPYLALSALLMAGLDGITRKLSPGDAMDQNLYGLFSEEKMLASSLKEALDALEQDHDFLLHGDVFTPDQLSAYIDLKRRDVAIIEQSPHPKEFSLYYSL